LILLENLKKFHAQQLNDETLKSEIKLDSKPRIDLKISSKSTNNEAKEVTIDYKDKITSQRLKKIT
jgi:hypothetical protein